MDEAIARHLVRTNFRCSRELQDLLKILKMQLPAVEFDIHAKRVAMAIAHLGDALSNPALAAYPALEQEIENDLSSYGQFL